MSDAPSPRDPHEDRLLEISLEEKLGGAKPTELDAAELARRAAEVAPAARRGTAPTRWLAAAIAVLVLAGVSVGGWWLLSQDYRQTPREIARVEDKSFDAEENLPPSARADQEIDLPAMRDSASQSQEMIVSPSEEAEEPAEARPYSAFDAEDRAAPARTASEPESEEVTVNGDWAAGSDDGRFEESENFDLVPQSGGEGDSSGHGSGQADPWSAGEGEPETFLSGAPSEEEETDRTVDPERVWQRAAATPNATRLMVGNHDDLPCEGMQFSVTVDGFRARVLIDCYFYNDQDLQLEGDFRMRLPNEASLYYFAFGETSIAYDPHAAESLEEGFLNKDQILAAGTSPDEILAGRRDSWQQPKEARIVPREQASYAYGQTVRRRVDPALVEWAGAGVFNARVFPLEPGKLHRIVIGYDVNLVRAGDDLVYTLDVPADLPSCAVEIVAANLPGLEPTIEPEIAPFAPVGRNYYHVPKASGETITLRYRHPAALALSGHDEADNPYFAIDVNPGVPAEEMATGNSHALFLVDTSLSSHPERFNIWLDLLEATLEANRGEMTHFNVMFFNVESYWWQQEYVENTEENVADLIAEMNRLSLEGASDLSTALTEAAVPSWSLDGEFPPADLFLFSDGAATWGDIATASLVRRLEQAGAGPLFAYQTGLAGTASAVLDILARETGGAVFSVTSEEQIAAASTAHRQRPWLLHRIEIAGGEDLLVAGRPRSVYPGQQLMVVGRGKLKAGDEIVFHIARGEEVRELHVPLEQVLESNLAARVYGQVAVGQLEELLVSTEDVAVAFARHFRVTGAACSLLMLETDADYEQFNIRPEDDAFVVASSPAGTTVGTALDELGERLGDPRADFTHWLARMEQMPGFEFNLSTALKLAIEQMPDESFQVELPRLTCQVRENAQIPDEYFLQLHEDHLSYDVVASEAQRRLVEFGGDDALKALSSLVESNPGDSVLLTDVAYSAIEWELGGQAYPLLKRVAQARPYQPQVYQAMAQCLAEMDRADLALVYYELALAGRWDPRFGEINRVVGVEYAHFLHRVEAGELQTSVPEYVSSRLETLAEQYDLSDTDLVVVMMWNTDQTDIDLHVLEPSGEDCHYAFPSTASGGHITQDVTQGFGPEMYTLPEAPAGEYNVSLHFYGSSARRTQVSTKVYVTVYEHFGTPEERMTRRVLELANQAETRLVMTVDVPAAKEKVPE